MDTQQTTPRKWTEETAEEIIATAKVLRPAMPAGDEFNTRAIELAWEIWKDHRDRQDRSRDAMLMHALPLNYQQMGDFPGGMIGAGGPPPGCASRAQTCGKLKRATPEDVKEDPKEDILQPEFLAKSLLEAGFNKTTMNDVVTAFDKLWAGKSEADIDKAMQPFQRLDSSRNPVTGGSGLGLTIAVDLATHCGADLRLAPRPGGGLVAAVRFSR